MKQLDWGQFDIFALALPRGHAFGNDVPIEIWQSEDQKGCAIIRRHELTGAIGLLVMRRRDDSVWITPAMRNPFPTWAVPGRGRRSN